MLTKRKYPAKVTCPYCDGHGHNTVANTECGFCDNGVLTVTQPVIPEDVSWALTI